MRFVVSALLDHNSPEKIVDPNLKETKKSVCDTGEIVPTVENWPWSRDFISL